jgi:hypothetical protein
MTTIPNMMELLQRDTPSARVRNMPINSVDKRTLQQMYEPRLIRVSQDVFYRADLTEDKFNRVFNKFTRDLVPELRSKFHIIYATPFYIHFLAQKTGTSTEVTGIYIGTTPQAPPLLGGVMDAHASHLSNASGALNNDQCKYFSGSVKLGETAVAALATIATESTELNDPTRVHAFVVKAHIFESSSFQQNMARIASVFEPGFQVPTSVVTNYPIGTEDQRQLGTVGTFAIFRRDTAPSYLQQPIYSTHGFNYESQPCWLAKFYQNPRVPDGAPAVSQHAAMTAAEADNRPSTAARNDTLPTRPSTAAQQAAAAAIAGLQNFTSGRGNGRGSGRGSGQIGPASLRTADLSYSTRQPTVRRGRG